MIVKFLGYICRKFIYFISAIIFSIVILAFMHQYLNTSLNGVVQNIIQNLK